MGSWGFGVYENDHAMDLFGTAVEDLGEELEGALNVKNASWTDIEGPLIYVRILTVLADELPLELDSSTVEGWKARYLQIYDSSLERSGATEKGKPRRAVIVQTFDSLLSRLDDEDDEDDDSPEVKKASKVASPKKPPKKTPAPKKTPPPKKTPNTKKKSLN